MPNVPEGIDPEMIIAMESTRAVATQVREFYLALLELKFNESQAMILICKWLESMLMAAASTRSASQ